MKNIVASSLIIIGKCILNIIYFFIKIFPTKNRITFISRQSNIKTLDFTLLEEELKKLSKNIDIVILCKKLNKGLKAKICYALYMFKMMYYIATSKVCIIDGYCIPISILKHKKRLIIIQIWHASGAIKKFGYQILGKNEGSSKEMAKLMCMHKNYSYLLAPSSITKNIYSQAFNIEKDKILIIGMPRLDYIQNNDEIIKNKFYSQYPNFKDKENILYIPTFRKDSNINLDEILNSKLDESKYNLIIRLHPLDKTYVNEKYLVDKEYNTYDLLKICDYIITDYSATLIEASLLEKPIFLYLYDYEKYNDNRGLNINIKKELSSFTARNFNDIVDKIEKKDYNINQIKNFRKKYIEVGNNNTNKLANFIINTMKER